MSIHNNNTQEKDENKKGIEKDVKDVLVSIMKEYYGREYRNEYVNYWDCGNYFKCYVLETVDGNANMPVSHNDDEIKKETFTTLNVFGAFQRVMGNVNILNKNETTHQKENVIQDQLSVVYTGDKYFVDTLTYKSVDEYIKNLKSSAHRKSIARFRKDFEKNKGEIVHVKKGSVMNMYFKLLPLHMEVQARNKSKLNERFLNICLRYCDNSDNAFLVVINNKDKETVAFGFYTLTTFDNCNLYNKFSSNRVLSLVLVGNNFEKGSIFSAYHNLLFESVVMAHSQKAILDLGLSHLSVKKVYEPITIPMYLKYIGNSYLFGSFVWIISKLQQFNMIQAPLQKQ